MRQYLDLMQDILDNGTDSPDRTGTGTRAVFGRQLRFDLSQGFPLLTTKKLHIRSIVHELLWFLSGSTNIHPLNEQRVSIWDEWADDNGELGPIYGHQWRSWPAPDGSSIDQVTKLLDGLKNDPFSRRHIISAWNVADLERMALPPCHSLFQFHVSQGQLSCQLYQRSADVFLGLPFNIMSYALLIHMVAQQVNLRPGHFIHVLGDAHLYLNHLDQARTQLARPPRALPRLEITRKPESLFDYQFEDFKITGYDPHPHLSAPIAV